MQIVFAQRNLRRITVVSIIKSAAIHCEALANTVAGYIAARVRVIVSFRVRVRLTQLDKCAARLVKRTACFVKGAD